MRTFSLLVFIITYLGFNTCDAQTKILFDATKAESAANADWIIDADIYNVGFGGGNPSIGGSGTEANPQRFPTPAQSMVTANTAEDFWKGGLSAYAIDCVKKGYQVETLPIGAKITYNDATNAQDLKNYKVFVICEPNILFSASEKTAIKNFVENGGGLIAAIGHDGSDRNFDGFDSPRIWNDFMTTFNNPFGITADLVDFSETTSNIPVTTNDPLLNGVYGKVTQAKFSGATTFTLDPTKNNSVKGVIFRKGATFGNTNVCVAYCSFGKGRVVVVGDSSPFDDGTGDVNDILYEGWLKDAAGNHQKLIMNATVWLATNNVTPALAIQTTQTNINCAGEKTGTAAVTASGSTGTYGYLWSNGFTTSTISNLAAGVYAVTVTSGTEKANSSVTITEVLPKLQAIASGVSTLTCAQPAGVIFINAIGGNPPYTYLWSDKINTAANLTVNKSGTYDVTATDSKGCKATATYTVNENKTTPTIETKTSNPNCANYCVEITKPIGNNYTYLWANGTSLQKSCLNNNNTFSVTVTNSQNGCFSNTKVTVTEPAVIKVNLISSTKATGSEKNGSAIINVTGGIAPFKFQWTDVNNKIVDTTQNLNKSLS
jgi:hypothetical protein